MNVLHYTKELFPEVTDEDICRHESYSRVISNPGQVEPKVASFARNYAVRVSGHRDSAERRLIQEMMR
jgi:hypothetical protein